MPDDVARLPWTEEQWATIQRIVQESARKARVASSFLPLVGPLPDGQATVPALRMDEEDLDERPQRGESDTRLEVDDGECLRLTTIACHVYLTTQQAADAELSSAKQMLGRAADIIGRLEDAIVFTGQDTDGEPIGVPPGLPQVYTVQGGQMNAGLLDAQCRCTVNSDDPERLSDNLVTTVVAAIQSLEGKGHYGPFACVLGHDLYRIANTPNRSLVLPSDRIVPFLDGGPLRRSSVIPRYQGVVVALAGSPIDLVVAKDVHVKYLQLTLEPRYVLRVSERLVLRIKQKGAVCTLTADVKAVGDENPCRETTTDETTTEEKQGKTTKDEKEGKRTGRRRTTPASESATSDENAS